MNLQFEKERKKNYKIQNSPYEKSLAYVAY